MWASKTPRDIELLNADEDRHGGVIVNMEKPMDSVVFSSLLEASISHWRQQVQKFYIIIRTNY